MLHWKDKLNLSNRLKHTSNSLTSGTSIEAFKRFYCCLSWSPGLSNHDASPCSCVCVRWFLTFYHGNSPLSHHYWMSDMLVYVLCFPTTLSKSSWFVVGFPFKISHVHFYRDWDWVQTHSHFLNQGCLCSQVWLCFGSYSDCGRTEAWAMNIFHGDNKRWWRNALIEGRSFGEWPPDRNFSRGDIPHSGWWFTIHLVKL